MRRKRESIQNDLDTIQTKKKKKKKKRTQRGIYDHRQEKKDAEHKEEKI